MDVALTVSATIAREFLMLSTVSQAGDERKSPSGGSTRYLAAGIPRPLIFLKVATLMLKSDDGQLTKN